MARAGREVRVRRYPAGAVTAADFDVVEVPVADPSPGQVVVRNTWTSVDPGLRLRLRPDAPAGYFAAFPLGRAMDGIMAVGEVVESRADGYRKHPLERCLTDLVNVQVPSEPVARYVSPLQRAALRATLEMTPTSRRPPSPYPRARVETPLSHPR